MTLAQCLEVCGGPRAADRMTLASRIQSGMPLDTVLKEAPGWLPKADRIFISAAAQTGRLPQTFKILSERHSRVGSNQLKASLSLIYPLGIFHFGALIMPINSMISFEDGFRFNPTLYLGEVLSLLVPVWVAIAVIVFLVRTDNPLLPGLMRLIPLLRGYSRARSVSDFAYALGTFLDAGVPIRRSWQGAAMVAADPEIIKAARELKSTFDREEDPAPRLKQFRCFPADFIALYQSGAMSGQLDQNLLALGRQYQEKANRYMTMVAMVYPTILFIAVVGYIILNILTMYMGYLNALTGIMDS